MFLKTVFEDKFKAMSDPYFFDTFTATISPEFIGNLINKTKTFQKSGILEESSTPDSSFLSFHSFSEELNNKISPSNTQPELPIILSKEDCENKVKILFHKIESQKKQKSVPIISNIYLSLFLMGVAQIYSRVELLWNIISKNYTVV